MCRHGSTAVRRNLCLAVLATRAAPMTTGLPASPRTPAAAAARPISSPGRSGGGPRRTASGIPRPTSRGEQAMRDAAAKLVRSQAAGHRLLCLRPRPCLRLLCLVPVVVAGVCRTQPASAQHVQLSQSLLRGHRLMAGLTSPVPGRPHVRSDWYTSPQDFLVCFAPCRAPQSPSASPWPRATASARPRTPRRMPPASELRPLWPRT